MTQVLLPLKDLVKAKSRLSGLLSPSERRALAQAMVEDVLVVLAQHGEISCITLVSDDPGAGMLAQKYGADYLPETALGCRGLNRVVAAAASRLVQDHSAPMLVLHGDLPLLSLADISAVLARQRQRGGLVIGCDRHNIGSNLLAFPQGSMQQFYFGAHSCQRHGEAARALGMHSSVMLRPGIALDLDEAADMRELMQQLDRAGRHTRALLVHSDLGSRVALALNMTTPQAQGVQTQKERGNHE